MHQIKNPVFLTDKMLKAKTGFVTDAYFSGTKLKWIVDNAKGMRERVRAHLDKERGQSLF